MEVSTSSCTLSHSVWVRQNLIHLARLAQNVPSASSTDADDLWSDCPLQQQQKPKQSLAAARCFNLRRSTARSAVATHSNLFIS